MGAVEKRSLKRLRNDVGDEAYGDLLNSILDDLSRLLAEVGASVRARDAEAMKRAAHELKGVAVLFGGRQLARSCDDVMRLDPSDVDGAERRFEELIASCGAALRAIEAEKSEDRLTREGR